MPRAFHLSHPRRSLGQRLAAVALFALQGAMALSPLWEPGSEARLSAHAEQDGARHLNLHNEATCALCTVRAQTSMPAAASPPIVASQVHIAVASVAYAAPVAGASSTNHARAPPRSAPRTG
jgi:hypothetical protein